MSDETQNVPYTCDDCHGTGMVFEHHPLCDDDLCVLNGDQWSCEGHMWHCGCERGQALMQAEIDQELQAVAAIRRTG